ncbi:MAG TPA: MaoC family dehydratase, partial [Alphaproteobacteria bacterium]|nr:MaoC family dehydratase [Alphaproteobacteria bacterium]
MTNANLLKTSYVEDLQIGMEASLTKKVQEKDVLSFSEISGDKNPVHLDAAFAKTTRFKERIAHGLLSASFISAVFGMKMPGPGSIYLSQTLQFKAPVKIGDTVTAKVKVKNIDLNRARVIFETTCSVGELLVI